MLRDIVRDMIDRQTDMQVVGEVSSRDDDIASSSVADVDVLVAGLADDSLSEPYARLMRRNPELTVLGITGDAKRAFLFELRPHRIPLGDASPDGLLGAIRAASRPDAN